MDWIGLVVFVVGVVLSVFFKTKADTAKAVATMAEEAATKLIEGIERGRNTGDHLTADSVKHIVKGLMECAPPEVRTYFHILKVGTVGL